MNWEALKSQKKRKHLNGLWFIKFKLSIVQVYYQQNRFENCLALIEKMKKDCKVLNDKQTANMLSEIEARIYVRQGLIPQGLQLLRDCAQESTALSSNAG